MALTSLVSENSTAPERIIGSQVDLVIDLSSLNFNGVSQDKVKEVINKRAEEQVDADDEIKAIKDFIKSGKATFDSIMDASLISAEKRLRDILVEAGVEAVNIKVALTELASSIDFKLTDIGKERFNSVMDAKQVQSYYGASGVDVADCTLLTNTTTPSIIPPTPKPNIINNPYSGAGAEASNPTAVENKDSVTNNVNNLPVNYVQYNIRRSADADLEGDDGVQERDQIKDTKLQAKRILKKIKNGTDKDLAIVAENDQIGDRKINLATKEDKTYLKEHFMKPLKILCLRNAVAGRDIDPEIFWSILMSAHGKDGAKIADDKYRESNTSGLDIHNVKKFANQMSKLGKMYVQYNTQTDTQKSFNNGYIQQVVGMMDNYVRSAVDIADFNSGKTGVRDLYTKFNNASKNLSGVDILDGKKDEEKAKSLLDDTVWKESQSLTSAYRQSAVETYNIKQLVDNGSLFGKYKSTNEEGFANFLGDTSFSGGLDNSDMGLRGGQQILAQFRIAVEQYAYKEKLNIQDPNQLKKAQTGILKNILSFAAAKSQRDGNALIHTLLGSVTASTDIGKTMIGDKEHGGSGAGSLLSQHPGIVKYLQKTLIEYPGDIDAVMLYGDEKGGASATRLDTDKLLAQENLNTLDPERKQIIETVLTNPSNAAELKKYMDKYNNTGISQQQMLANIAEAVYGSIKGTSPLSISTGGPSLDKTVGKVSLTAGAGLGASISLAKHARLNMGMATNGASVMPAISLSFDQDIGKGWKIGETISLLPPGVGLALAKNRQSQKSLTAINKTLDTKAIVNYTVGADASVTYDGTGGLAGLNASAGIGFFKEKDYLGGIDKGYQERKTTSTSIISPIMKELQTAVEKKQYPDSKIRKQNLLDALNKQYPGGDDTTKNLMAENLMNAMANFGCTDISHLNDTMVAELSQQFAAQWKENAVMNLKDRKLTGFGFRLGASLSPFEMAKTILTLGLSFKISNFSKGFHYEDSAESILAVKQANEQGKGNRDVFTDSDSIGAREVEFMNRMFSSAQYRMNHYKVDAISMTPDNKFVSIPQGLRDAHAHVNLKLDPSLKGQIKIENGNLFVPANAPMRVSAHAGTSGVEYVLSLGSHFDKPDAVHLIKGRQLPTDRQAESLDKINYISPIEGLNKNPLTAESINSQIAALKVADNGAYKDFTLNVVSANSRQVILNGLSADSIDPSSPLKLDTNGQIIIPAGSKLTVSKLNNKFILTTASTPNEFSLTFENKDYTSGGITADEIAKRLSEKFYINITNPTLKDNILTYIDTSGKEWSVNINSGKIGDVSFSMSDKDLVLRKQGGSGTNSSPETITYDEADTDIEDKAMYDLDKAVKDSDIRKLFEKLEDYQKSDFYKFMGYVMERKVPEAAKVLKTMLNNNKPLKDKVPGLYASLDQDLRTQQLVIARMLTVFALEPDKKGILLKEVFKSRVDTYEKVGSPSGQKLDFIPRSMIEEWYKDVKFTDAKDTKPYDNILGYTAFYRKNAKGDQKGYALTAPGYTRTVSDKIIKIAEKDTNMAKKSMDWLIANIKNDPFAQSVIVDTLQKKFDAAKIDITLDIDKVIALLEDKSNETLMTNDKKIIKLNAKPIFYLCAECANESLGLQIESITSTDAVTQQEERIGGSLVNGATANSATIAFTTAQGNPLAINTTEASKSSLATTGEGSTHLGVTAGVGIKTSKQDEQWKSGNTGTGNGNGNTGNTGTGHTGNGMDEGP